MANPPTPVMPKKEQAHVRLIKSKEIDAVRPMPIFTTYATCDQATRHVAFIKVHKCGSSTAQNVFLRFGYERNLTFLLGKLKPNMPYSNVISIFGTLTDDNVAVAPNNKPFDISCLHVVYNREAFMRYMPADTKYIGIIRDPYEQFMSIVRYFRPSEVLSFGSNDPIGDFLTKFVGEDGGKPSFLVNNPIVTEFGIDPGLKENYDGVAMDKFLRSLERDFTLIIISEYFDESMVLLKRLLHWTTKDVLYISHNISDKKKFNVTVTARHRELLYKRFHLDVILYRHFYRRFWQQVRQQGEQFYDEVLSYKRIQRQVSQFCTKGEFATRKTLLVRKNLWNHEFRILKSDCQLLTMHELTFIKMIRQKQSPNAFIND